MSHKTFSGKMATRDRRNFRHPQQINHWRSVGKKSWRSEISPFSRDQDQIRLVGEYHFCHSCVEDERGRIRCVKYWEVIADNLSKAGWSLGWVSTVDSREQTIWIANAHRGDGKRFVVRAATK
jgi:hypothetical protein